MREQLATEIADLEAQEVNMTNEVERVGQTEPFDSHQYSSFKGELDTVQAKLAAKREELAKIDGAVETVQTDILASFESLSIPGSTETIPLSFLITTDRVPLEDKITIITSAHEQTLVNAAIVKASLESENQSKQDRIDTLESENDSLVRRNDDLDLKGADLQAKLHNAGNQIIELEIENKRKDEEINKLRDQLSKSAQPTNTKVESTESMQEGLAKRPAIYNVRWESELGRTHKLANLAETDEEIRYHYFNEGIYRILKQDELLQFRKEKEDKAAADAIESERLAQEALQNQSLVAPPFQFPSPTIDGLVVEPSEEVGTVGARKEYEARFKRIEEHLGLKTWRIDEDEAKEVA